MVRQATTDSPRLQRRRRRPHDDPPVVRARDRPDTGAARAPGIDAPALAQRQEALRELQARHGNAHVQQLLARQAADAPTAAPAQVWEGDHGTYYVFPDGEPLSLAQVQDSQKEWPISQRVAERLRPISALLTGAAGEVELRGNAPFKVALLMDLAWLREQPMGRELLDALLKSGRKLTLEFAPSGGPPEAASPTDAELRPTGEPGPGSDLVVRYAPEPWGPPGMSEDWSQRKPATGLAQALVAALPLMTGSAPSTMEREPVTESAQATGADQLQRALELENRVRAAFSLPLRPTT